MRALIALLRPLQWYKNAVIILAVIFAGKLFDAAIYPSLLLGFLSLCAISSANYIINDLKDREEDRKNPEKKNRPLASGRISQTQALATAIMLLLIGVSIAFFLSTPFGIAATSLFILTSLYSLKLKREAFADILLIAVNFVVRAVSGALIINVTISHWLIIGTFFFALFLATGKRTSEALLLGKKAHEHRENLTKYTPQITQFIMIISTTLLIISYTLYSFIGSEQELLIIALPVVLYTILRYFSLVEQGSIIARHPHLAVKDVRLVTGGMLSTIIIVLTLYL